MGYGSENLIIKQKLEDAIEYSYCVFQISEGRTVYLGCRLKAQPDKNTPTRYQGEQKSGKDSSASRDRYNSGASVPHACAIVIHFKVHCSETIRKHKH